MTEGRTLIVPDVHEQLYKLEALQPLFEEADHVVFLGDFFDTFERNPPTREMAEWLKDNVWKLKYHYLLGNHDCHYAFQNNGFQCTGYENRKQDIINDVLSPADWQMFHLFMRVGPYLCSHAGVTPKTKHFAARNQEVEALNVAFTGGFHNMFQVGRGRGGWAKVGGPTWLDWTSEFEPLPDQLQIVGHTQSRSIRSEEGSYCLDTNLRHVAWVEETGELKILEWI